MAFIGNTVQTQGFTPAIDYFSGNGVTVTFTLSRPLASVAQVVVSIDNVIQNPSSAFTVAGNAITFSSAPLSGTNNIWVEYTSLITTYQGISQDPSVIGDITATGGGFLSTGDFGNTFIDGTIVDYVTGNARITTGTADGLTIYNGGTAARNPLMTIDSSGNVGIGRTIMASNVRLYVNAGRTILAANSENYSLALQYNSSGGQYYIGATDSATPDMVFSNVGGAERMRIGYNGSVNIGGTTTGGYSEKLMVQSAGSVQASMMFLNPGIGSGQIGFTASSPNFKFRNTYADGTLTNGIGFDIDTGGNLLLGYPTAYPYSTTRCLGVVASNGSTISLQPTANAGFSSRIWHPNGSNVYFDNTTSASYVFSYGNGSAYAATTAASFNIGSDYRLKENIAPLMDALSRIQNFKPIRYTFKADNKIAMPWGTDVVDGFLAHEFAEVIPSAVTGEKDAVDENGDIVIQTLDMTKAIPLLVAAIQELKAEIDLLKAGK